MREGIEVGSAHLVDEFGRRPRAVDAGAQCDRVDEHSDQLRETGIGSSRDGCSDDNVGVGAAGVHGLVGAVVT
ncbi:Uncharacterised protein [Mycobacteroides abscessus subsp. abscessus]|nr:Uncharacterised protein [Mycobacteroides abscessus subsp. abscessus]